MTDEERQSLRINKMILHVVGGDEPFQAQSEMTSIDHPDFFLARLMDAAAAGVHEFDRGSLVKRMLESIAAGTTMFEGTSQEVSRHFGTYHGSTSRDGAFFIFELLTHEADVRIFALVKYDYRQAIERVDQGGTSALRQIIQAFIADRKAIQKSCFVRTRGGVAENSVSARDRMASAPDITDYFRRFLDVVRNRSDAELNRTLNEALREVFADCKDELPGEDVPGALAKAKDMLRNRQTIDDQAVLEAVFVAAGRPQDEKVKAKLEKATGRRLRTRKLEGLEYKPDPTILRKSNRKRLKTAEGVMIEYPGELENGSVKRVDGPDGGLTITVTTHQKLLADELLPEKFRSSS
ncbi:nucleoid-associated protein [Microvirga calopogonii]|uniref:nucleoid-associated protein n=1 Tax=Microvirga calopogonii TaxID=2078013 RepID=UPI0013B3A433|nr:nucleoid-associated protein [Microvirga calopogonii]